jgi:hypothetical protein
MKLPTLVPATPLCTKLLINIPAGSRLHLEFPAQVHRPFPISISRATQILEGTGHSRTLYTSKALEQSNFII